MPNNTFECIEIKNNVFKEIEVYSEPVSKSNMSVGDIIIALRQNRFIQEKKYGAISSFNFTKQAFFDKVWDEQTTKARGLYINIPKQKVVARAYEKFFNINERPETKLDMLEHRLAFPVTAYVKENGFLGIVSYNDEDDSLFVTTKSSPDGDFAGWLKDILYDELSEDAIEKLKQFSKEHNVSFVFECVDMKNDPHIIEYPENKLFLLDIVYNDFNFKKLDYVDMANIATELGLEYKTMGYVIENWSDFFDWYYEVTNEDYEFDGKKIEGFVIEDANGYMVKLKLQYYNFWKFMRSISHEAIRFGYVNPKRTSALTSALANQYYGWVRTLHDTDDLDSVPRDICTLRNMFYKTEAGKLFINE